MITKKQLTLIMIRNLVIIAIFAGVALSVVIYSANQMSQISNSVNEKKKISFALQKRSETYSNLKNEFSVLGNTEKALEGALVPSDDISNFISAIEALGVKNGVNQSYKFGAVNQATEQGGITVSNIDYSIKIRATMQSAILYLKNFEDMPYFSSILNISVTPNTAEGLNGVSDVLLNARLYTKQSI